MTYVYVLVSSHNKDLYYEQALMSLFSLRLYMKSAKVLLLTDTKTAESFSQDTGREKLAKLATEVKTIDFPETTSNVERSRLIKTAIPQYVDDDFLYIDCDTIIAGDLSSIETCPFQTAGVLDGHCMIDSHIHKRTFLARDKRLGFSGTEELGYNVNGGVIFAKKGTETIELFEKWNKLWWYSAYKKKDFHDQSALNEAIRILGKKTGLLSGEWNCQLSHGGLAFLQNAKIIHYYSSESSSNNFIPYYKISDPAIQKLVGLKGAIPPEVIKMIKAPRFLFNSVHLVSDKRILSVMQSPLVFSLADIKANIPPIFAVLEEIARGMRAIGAFSKKTISKIKTRKK